MSAKFQQDHLITGCIISTKFYRMVIETGMNQIQIIFGEADHSTAFKKIVKAYERYGNADLRNISVQDEDLRKTITPYVDEEAQRNMAGIWDMFTDPEMFQGLVDMVRGWIFKTIKDLRQTRKKEYLEAISLACENADLENIHKYTHQLTELMKVSTEYSEAQSAEDMINELGNVRNLTAGRFLCGIDMFDTNINFLPGNLWTIIAAPGFGKTTLMHQVLVNMLKRYKSKTCMYFNTEMNASECAAGMINYTMSHGIKEDDAKQLLKEMNLKFYYNIRDIDEICNKVRFEKELNDDVAFVFIDYIQRCKDSTVKSSIFDQMASCAEKITSLAKDTRVFIIVLSQPDKDSFQTKRITMYSVKGGGELVQSSSYISVINAMTEDEAGNAILTHKDDLKSSGLSPVWVDFGKARFSKRTCAPMLFKGSEARFYETEGGVLNTYSPINEYKKDD